MSFLQRAFQCPNEKALNQPSKDEHSINVDLTSINKQICQMIGILRQTPTFDPFEAVSIRKIFRKLGYIHQSSIII